MKLCNEQFEQTVNLNWLYLYISNQIYGTLVNKFLIVNCNAKFCKIPTMILVYMIACDINVSPRVIIILVYTCIYWLLSHDLHNYHA